MSVLATVLRRPHVRIVDRGTLGCKHPVTVPTAENGRAPGSQALGRSASWMRDGRGTGCSSTRKRARFSKATIANGTGVPTSDRVRAERSVSADGAL
jgi:hypothetical protein